MRPAEMFDARLQARLVVPEDPDACWGWLGHRERLGYVRVYRNRDGKPFRHFLHRITYEHFVGPIPQELEIDHLCRNRACGNPRHLEAVTHQVNILRGTSPFAEQARRTHCVHGHPFDEANTLVRGDGRRNCKTCYREAALKRRSRWRRTA